MIIQNNYANILRASKLISKDIGILSYVSELPMMNADPQLIAYGIWPCDTSALCSETYGGRSSGCDYKWESAFLATVGETVERYCSAFYDLKKGIHAPFRELNRPAVHPSEYALFHPEQYKNKKYLIEPFTEEVDLTWFPTIDLTDGQEKWTPGAFIYMPWTKEKRWVNLGTSTGLAAHTSLNKALLVALYEAMERDSFVLTWNQKIVPPKIKITPEVNKLLETHYPGDYDWHFFNMTYDLEVPSVFGICFGKSEFGDFVAVGTSTRATMGEAMQKVIKEVGQAVAYFRYLLSLKGDWEPNDDFHQLTNFEDHSVYYLKRKDLWHVFDRWVEAEPTETVDLYAKDERSDTEKIQEIMTIMKKKNYNVLFKDLTTPDVHQAGFYSIRVFIPQLIQMAGIYSYYYLGAKRLYEVPAKMGYTSHDYENLNHYPHPFP